MRDPLELTSGQLNELVWGWKPAITHRELQDRFQIHSEQMWSARIGAVARYLNVRDKELMATVSTKSMVFSVRMKWDETTQIASSGAPEQIEAPTTSGPQHNDDAVGTGAMSTMVMRMFVKNNFCACSEPVALPLAWLERTTAECIVEGWERMSPIDFKQLRSECGAPWVVFVLVADAASSNHRAVATFRSRLRRSWSNVVVLPVDCFMHVLHRCYTPVFKVINIVNPLYRMANTVNKGAVWFLMLRALRAYVASKLLVVHGQSPDEGPNPELVADVLALTLGEGLEEPMLPKRKRNLIKELRRHFMLLRGLAIARAAVLRYQSL